jgi:tetratricopeptide (TPR) repeat protein
LWVQITKVAGVGRAEVCTVLGRKCFDAGKYAQSLALCETARGIYESLGAAVPDVELAQVYLGIVSSLAKLDRPADAARYSDRAIELLREVDPSGAAEMLRTQGRYWYDAKEYELSLQCHMKASSDPDPDADDSSVGLDTFNIALCYLMMEGWSEAISLYNEARALFLRTADPTWVAYCDEQLAECHIKVGNGVKAEHHAQLALDYANTALDNDRQRYSNYYLAMAKKLMGDVESTEKYLRDAQYMITVGGRKDWPLLIKVEKELAQVMHQTHRSDQGDEIIRRLKGIEDTLSRGSKLK